MAFQYGQEVDSLGNITQVGSWGVSSSPKVSIPIIIENLRLLKDGIASTTSDYGLITSTMDSEDDYGGLV